jgi:hypothetical protein
MVGKPAVPGHCIPAGPTGPQQFCSSDAACQAGYHCIGRVCKQVCGEASDCRINGRTPPPTSTTLKCNTAIDSTMNVIAGDNYCTSGCNPVTPQQADVTHNACGAGAWCTPDVDGTTDCFALDNTNSTQNIGGGGRQGTPCGDVTDCLPGFDCIGDANSVCAHFCRVALARTPADDCRTWGGTCTSISPKMYDEKTEIGFCSQ